MMRSAMAVLVAGTNSALAQQSASWFAEFDISDDATSVDVTMWISMQSDTPFVALGWAEFDTLIQDGSEYGSIIDWQVLHDLDAAPGDTTTTDGDSLFGTLAVQFPPFPPFDESNPLDVMSFTWVADDGFVIADVGAAVSYMTNTHALSLWVGESFEKSEVVDLPLESVAEATFGWHVIPTPGAPTVVIASGCLAFSRRRTRQNPEGDS